MESVGHSRVRGAFVVDVRCFAYASEGQRVAVAARGRRLVPSRQRGGHRQYHHVMKPGSVTVAGKSSVEVPPGTLSGILKQADLKK